jgi:hypothetical protein
MHLSCFPTTNLLRFFSFFMRHGSRLDPPNRLLTEQFGQLSFVGVCPVVLP